MKLNVQDLGFAYNQQAVLKEISFDINEPQLACILGPNGVGKSTLIHCINKILNVTHGTVLIDDQNIKDMSLKQMAQLTGYVPYTSSDSFPMTVVDTVLLGRHPRSNWKSTANDVKIVYELLELLDIKHLAMRPFNKLSAGQHQKVMLARGLAQDPEILLLDEPTANLDVKHQLDVTRLLYKLSREKKIIVIMICHDLNIAAKYADNILLMSKGTIYAAGKPEDVMTENNIREVYGVDSKVIIDEGRPHVILRDGTNYVAEGSIEAEIHPEMTESPTE